SDADAMASSRTGSGGTIVGSATGSGGEGGRAAGFVVGAGGGGVGRATGGTFLWQPIAARSDITASSFAIRFIVSPCTTLHRRTWRLPTGAPRRDRGRTCIFVFIATSPAAGCFRSW